MNFVTSFEELNIPFFFFGVAQAKNPMITKEIYLCIHNYILSLSRILNLCPEFTVNFTKGMIMSH